MGLVYTKKNEDDDDKTVNATEFINRLVDSNRMTKKVKEEPKTEAPK